MDHAAADASVHHLESWFLSPTSWSLTFEEALSVACEHLVACGMPLWQLRVLLLTQHPEVSGIVYQWRAGERVIATPTPHELTASPMYTGSPIDIAQRSRKRVRVRLEDPSERDRFPHLREFVELGGTDYVADPLLLVDGRVSCASATTKQPGGFSATDLDVLERLNPIVSARVAIRSIQHARDALLATYLGPNAARRVLSGSFRRGTGETTRAAVWFCDLRGFTTMSDTLPAREVVATLDDFFEVITGAVEERGGEVLKFIGDAALAFFPVDNLGDGPACRRAIAASTDARRAVERLNGKRVGDGRAPLAMGIAVHVGDVFYGNIGGRRRLDFTVIGSAVNEAARLQSMGKDLGVSLVISGAAAEAAALEGLASLGVHALRGVSAPQEVFTLRELVDGVR